MQDGTRYANLKYCYYYSMVVNKSFMLHPTMLPVLSEAERSCPRTFTLMTQCHRALSSYTARKNLVVFLRLRCKCLRSRASFNHRLIQIRSARSASISCSSLPKEYSRQWAGSIKWTRKSRCTIYLYTILVDCGYWMDLTPKKLTLKIQSC